MLIITIIIIIKIITTIIITIIIIMVIIIKVIIIIAIIVIIKIIPIIAVILIINSSFQPGDFSSGSITIMCLIIEKKLTRLHWVLNVKNDKRIKLINPTETHACMANKNIVWKKKLNGKHNKIKQKSLILIALRKKT